MARTAGKKQAPAKIEEDDDDGWDDAVVEADGKDGEADLRLRDWRDVERFREMKELRSLVDDDYGLEEIFHVPLKPRIVVPPRQPKVSAKGQAAKGQAAGKHPEPKAAPKAAAKLVPPARHAPAKKAAPAKARAKPAPSSARARTEGVKPKPKRR